MGYTHYFQLLNEINKPIIDLALNKLSTYIFHYNKGIPKGYTNRLSGVTAHHQKAYDIYEKVHFNGSYDERHEDFYITYNDIYKFNFCKTNQKSYDIVVVASLFVLKHFFKNDFKFATDGKKEDLREGYNLACTWLQKDSLDMKYSPKKREVIYDKRK